MASEGSTDSDAIVEAADDQGVARRFVMAVPNEFALKLYQVEMIVGHPAMILGAQWSEKPAIFPLVLFAAQVSESRQACSVTPPEPALPRHVT